MLNWNGLGPKRLLLLLSREFTYSFVISDTETGNHVCLLKIFLGERSKHQDPPTAIPYRRDEARYVILVEKGVKISVLQADFFNTFCKQMMVIINTNMLQYIG